MILSLYKRIRVSENPVFSHILCSDYKTFYFRLSGQKIKFVKETKSLGGYLNENLSWNFHLNQLKSKLSRNCGLLAKLRYCAKTDLLRTVYFAIFDSILRYDIQVWEQHKNQTLRQIEKYNKKLLE